MSVQENWCIAVNGPADGLEVAVRLATVIGAELRWVAAWPARPSNITSHFGPRLVSRSLEPAFMVLLPSPTLDDVRSFVAHAEDAPVCIHWSPRLYDADEGRDAPWISFVDGSGLRRDDARVYRLELAGNAVPLTTMGDRATDHDLVFGPATAVGWALQLVSIRDHMSSEQFTQWIAAAASVAPESLSRLCSPRDTTP